MDSQILRDALDAIAQRRMEGEREEARRRFELAERCPEVMALSDQRQQLIFDSCRAILDGRETGEDLPEKMVALNQKIEDTLVKNGYPAKYLERVCTCEKCGDTGYVGEPVREMCVCLREMVNRAMLRKIGLQDNGESFDCYDETRFDNTAILPEIGVTQRKWMDRIRKKCENYATKYPECEKKTMVLSGPSGLGKTFLLHAMAKELLSRGVNVLLISAYRFLEVARRAYIERKTEEMDALMTADVLMIDDLGTEPLMENITITQLFNLINERQRLNLGTVFSTNLPDNEIRRIYNERIYTRLMDRQHCEFLTFLGKDIRL